MTQGNTDIQRAQETAGPVLPPSEPSAAPGLSPLDMAHNLAAVINASDDAIIGETLDNTVVTWNRGAERIYGFAAAEVIGKSMTVLVPQDLAGEQQTILERVREGERLEHFETVRLTKSGQRIDMDLIVSPTRDADGNIAGALIIGRDISAYKRTASELQELQSSAENRALVLETANRVALDILSSNTGVEALQRIVDTARTLAQARYAALGIARPDGGGLYEFITSGLTPDEEAVIGPRPVGAGVLGLLLHRQEPLRIDRISGHPASVGFPPHHPPMDNFLGVPIRRGNVILGSLYLTTKQGGSRFTEADEAAVEALGAHAAVAINNMLMLSRQRALVSGMIAAQEEERRALAYELHDGLTQYVMASHAHLTAYRRARNAGNEDRATRELDQGLHYLKDAVIESRRLVTGLRSLALDDMGLAGALEQLVSEEKARAAWEDADLIHNIAGQRFDKSQETAVYRVAQEALTNARKHAETQKVRVLLLIGRNAQTGAEELTLDVRDWGKGFIPEQKTQDYAHLGLQGIIERVLLIGGTHRLQSAPGAGTTVHAVFPVLPAAPETDGGGER